MPERAFKGVELAHPVAVSGYRGEVVSELLDLTRSTARSGSQRWEWRARLRPLQPGKPDAAFEAAVAALLGAGPGTTLVAPAPQLVAGTPLVESGSLVLAAAAAAGAESLSVRRASGPADAGLPAARFVRVANHAKFYNAASALSPFADTVTAQTLAIYPPLTTAAAAGTALDLKPEARAQLRSVPALESSDAGVLSPVLDLVEDLATPSVAGALGVIQGNVNAVASGVAASVQLAAAFGGAAPYVYSVTGLPAGVTFAASTRTLTAAANRNGSASITYTVIDSAGATASDTFTLTFDTRAPLSLVQGPVNLVTASRAAGTVVLAAATGGKTPYTYSVTGLPAGVTFAASTRTLTVAANRNGSAVLSYRVRDSDSRQRTISVTLTYDTRGVLALSQADLTLEASNKAASQALAAATGGQTPYTYSVTGLPAGVTFAASTRTLTVAANRNGSASITYSVTDGAGATASDTFTLTYDTRASSNLALSQGNLSLTGNNASRSSVLAAATGGQTPYTYSVTGLPAGVTFAASTRTLTVAANRNGSASITYSVTDGAGATASDTFTLTYDTRASSNLALSQGNLSLTGNNASRSSVLAAATGGQTPYTYSVTGLPAGVTFAASTRTLTVAANRNGSASITYSVTDGAGATASDTFTLTYDTRASSNLALTQSSVSLRGPSASRVLSSATGGTAPYTYSASGLGSYLAFNASTRTLSISSDNKSGSQFIKYKVTDAAGSSVEISVLVTYNSFPHPSLSQPDVALTGSSRSAVLAAATGGTPPYTYSLSGYNSTQLSWDAVTRTITALGNADFTDNVIIYQVRDKNNALDTDIFGVTFDADG